VRGCKLSDEVLGKLSGVCHLPSSVFLLVVFDQGNGAAVYTCGVQQIAQNRHCPSPGLDLCSFGCHKLIEPVSAVHGVVVSTNDGRALIVIS